MAELFGKDKSSISRHLKNIFESGELAKEASVAKFATVQNEVNSLPEHFIASCKELCPEAG